MSASSVVHVIDDDDAVRRSLDFLLGSCGLAVTTYDSAAAFLQAVPNLEGGCVITDVRMPDIDGLELLRRLKSLNVSLPVIVITGHGDILLAVEAIKLGAVDIIEKPFDQDALLAAIRQALADEGTSKAARLEIARRLETLSPHERQVLASILAGRETVTVASDLGVSPRAVEVYQANMMTKMQATSLSELVRLALLGGVAPIGGQS